VAAPAEKLRVPTHFNSELPGCGAANALPVFSWPLSLSRLGGSVGEISVGASNYGFLPPIFALFFCGVATFGELFWGSFCEVRQDRHLPTEGRRSLEGLTNDECVRRAWRADLRSRTRALHVGDLCVSIEISPRTERTSHEFNLVQHSDPGRMPRGFGSGGAALKMVWIWPKEVLGLAETGLAI
jgi:hypothetical protein